MNKDSRTYETPSWVRTYKKYNRSYVLRETIAELTPLALHKHQQIELDIDDQKYVFLSQAPLLNILFSNLVDNAIRYTPAGGSIIVKVVEEANLLRISVMDSGVGVNEDQLHRLGEAFFRVDSGKGDGTGLGLTIVKRISELLQMSVTFANREPSGLVVTVSMGRPLQ